MQLRAISALPSSTPALRPWFARWFVYSAVAAAVVASSLAIPQAARASGGPVGLAFDGKTRKLNGFPSTLKGGLTTFTLKSSSYGVSLQLAKLTGTHTDAEIEKAVNSDDAPPTWVVPYGGTVAMSGVGATSTATANLDRGSYVWIVFSAGGQLDKKSPWARFTVTGPKSATQPTGGTATIKTLEYGFDVDGLKSGPTTVNYVNGGKEWHHVIIQKLKPGKTLADFQKAVASGPTPDGLVDDKASLGFPVLSPGLSEVASIDLTPGIYVFACFMPDKTGKPHAMSGMVREIKVS